tara:strand:+ start:234 stop:737 length:504 start_codon:yes stop_codon:yes gene_type:complete
MLAESSRRSDNLSLNEFELLKTKEMDEVFNRKGIRGGGGTRAKRIDRYRKFLQTGDTGLTAKVERGGTRGKNFTIGETCRLIHILCDPDYRSRISGLYEVTSDRLEIEAGQLKMTVFDEPSVDEFGNQREGGSIWTAFHDEDRVYDIVDFDMFDFPQLYKVIHDQYQ